jgi:hypothetical protein
MGASRRPHLKEIASGLLDSRLSGVDFWDTEAGHRLLAGKPHDAPARPPIWQRLRTRRGGHPR